jgi:hypothetical protein
MVGVLSSTSCFIIHLFIIILFVVVSVAGCKSTTKCAYECV